MSAFTPPLPPGAKLGDYFTHGGAVWVVTHGAGTGLTARLTTVTTTSVAPPWGSAARPIPAVSVRTAPINPDPAPEPVPDGLQPYLAHALLFWGPLAAVDPAAAAGIPPASHELNVACTHCGVQAGDPCKLKMHGATTREHSRYTDACMVSRRIRENTTQGITAAVTDITVGTAQALAVRMAHTPTERYADFVTCPQCDAPPHTHCRHAAAVPYHVDRLVAADWFLAALEEFVQADGETP